MKIHNDKYRNKTTARYIYHSDLYMYSDYRCMMISSNISNNHLPQNLRFKARRSLLPLKDMSSYKEHEVVEQLKQRCEINNRKGTAKNGRKVNESTFFNRDDTYFDGNLQIEDMESYVLNSPSELIFLQIKIDESRSREMGLLFDHCTSNCKNYLVEKAREHTSLLIQTMSGCWFLLKLAHHNTSFNEWLIKVCLRSFEKYIRIEESSYVMRSLLETSKSFCASLNYLFKKNIDGYLLDPIARRTVICAIQNAPDEESRDLISHRINTNSKLWTSSRHLKTVVREYIKLCSNSRLSSIVEKMQIKTKFHCYLNDMDSSEIIFVLIQRGHVQTTQLLKKQLRSSFFKTVGAAYFSHLLGMIILDESTSFLTKQFYSILKSKGSEHMKDLQSDRCRIYVMYSSAISICSLVMDNI